jgi:uncharacterized protein (TIGR02145 family)
VWGNITLVFKFNNQTACKLKKIEMKRAKWINTVTCVFMLLFSYGSMSAISDRPVGLDSDQTTDKSAQTKTKTTQTGSKSVQTKSKTAQTKSKSSQTKPKTGQKTTKAEPDKKMEYPGTVRIGTQAWAVANLNVNTFRNGDTIPEAKTNKEWVAAGEAGKPAWCYYNNDPKIGLIYGKLYNWYAVNDPRGLAPAGWTLASDADWAKLINNLGGPGSAGAKMKSNGKWNEGSNGTNETGFTGYPGGYRVENGSFQNIGSIGIWWSSSENNPPSAFDHYLSMSGSCNRSNSPKQRGESVRCIRN